MPKEKPQSKPVANNQIPNEITEILNQRAKQLDRFIDTYKREHEACLRTEKELGECLNESNRSDRLHKKNLAQMKDEIEAHLDAERKKLLKERRVYERQNKAMKNLPNRKERDEIDKLVKQVKDLEEKVKIKEQRNKLTISSLKKQLTEAQERNQELIEERENVYLAVKGSKYEQPEDNKVEKDTYEEAQVVIKDHNDDYSADYAKYQPSYEDSKPRNNTGQHQRYQPINFYQPVNGPAEEKEDVDMNNMTHSPQFGSQKVDFASNNPSKAQTNNYIKPAFADMYNDKSEEED